MVVDNEQSSLHETSIYCKKNNISTLFLEYTLTDLLKWKKELHIKSQFQVAWKVIYSSDFPQCSKEPTEQVPTLSNCINSLAAIVHICGHHLTKRTMPVSAYEDSDFENSRCPSEVSDTKLTNTDDSLAIPCYFSLA